MIVDRFTSSANMDVQWRYLLLFVSIVLLFLSSKCDSKVYGPYKPTWESLDSRPVPEWFDNSKIGIFIHWGVFSVPSFGSEWFWSNWKISKSPSIIDFMSKNYKPNFSYAEFAPMFTASLFNATTWATLFKLSGAQYVVLTSKHHEGFTLWPSKYSWNWNSMDLGPKRDLVGEVATAVRNSGLRFGVYHSLYEWFNPLYLQDKSNSWKTRDFPERKTIPELYELVNTYEPEIVWSDGEWEASTEYWGSREFLAWLYNESPVKDSVCVNDRWGINTLCKHGGYLTCTDRYNPGKLLKRKWENAMTLDKTSWGYSRLSHITAYLTIEELIQTMAQTISCGGNLLINVGPTADGIIPPIMEERLLQLGQWLFINGEAIYKTKPWIYQNDTKTPEVWYTMSKHSDTVYAIVINRPKNGILQLSSMNETMKEQSKVSMITSTGHVPLKWSRKDNTIEITFIYSLHTQWAVVLKFTDLKDNHIDVSSTIQ